MTALFPRRALGASSFAIARPLACTMISALLAACLSDSGTIQVSVIAAPGSTLIESVQRIRLTLSDPRTVVEAVRGASGFSLALEAVADGEAGKIAVEGFDSNDRLIAYGLSPPFTIGPIDARVVVYLAPPQSMAIAPVQLAVPRFEIGAGSLAYGAILVGGRDNANAVRGEVELYNAYDHTLARGLDLPAPRAGAAVAATIDGRAFIIGGQGGDNQPSTLTWAFNTAAAPSGSYLELPNTAPARFGEHTVPISAARFLVTGSAAAQLDAINGLVTSLTSAPPLPTQMVSVLARDEIIAVGAGAAAVVRYRGGAFDTLAIPAALRTGHLVVTTADAQVAVIGGGDRDGLRSDAVKIDPIAGTGVTIPDVLEIPRSRPAVARAGALIVVAGGVSGSGVILDTAELLDATTLRHVATIPLVAPRAEAEAIALPNDQVLLIGGLDFRGRPTAMLELFTPGPSQ
jgi:hypothetical protein